jgi:hypothetical protein
MNQTRKCFTPLRITIIAFFLSNIGLGLTCFFSASNNSISSYIKIAKTILLALWIVLLFASILLFLFMRKKEKKYNLTNSENTFDVSAEYKMYKQCQYTEWREDFANKVKNQDLESLKKFLINKIRTYKNTYDIGSAVMIPTSITCIFSMDIVTGTDNTADLLGIAIGVGIFICLMVFELIETYDHISFFEDCVELCDEQLKSKNKTPVAEDTGDQKSGLDEKNIIVEKNENANRKTIITITIE